MDELTAIEDITSPGHYYAHRAIVDSRRDAVDDVVARVARDGYIWGTHVSGTSGRAVPVELEGGQHDGA